MSLNRGDNLDDFIKGLYLSECFFQERGLPIIKRYYPDLKFSAGLLGYGSDVLGYDDNISTDHMWGPRFYLFLIEEDIDNKDKLLECFETNLPYEYKGYSVNFSKPNMNDNGVRCPEFISSGKVSPLIWIYTIKDFINEYLGLYPCDNFQWLSLSEHRLLGFTSGKLFVDMLNLSKIRDEFSFYPLDVKLYLIASQWSLIAEEQAFVKRCSDSTDELGSRIVCTRIVERLMRLCFIYKNKYAPYSKWFGTGFKYLTIDDKIKNELYMALSANTIEERELHIVNAQVHVAKLHNESYITEVFKINVHNYFDRDIKVLSLDTLIEMIKNEIKDDRLKNIPFIGSLSQIGNFVELSDNPKYVWNVQSLYRY